MIPPWPSNPTPRSPWWRGFRWIGDKPTRVAVPPVGAPVIIAWTCIPEVGYCSGGERGIRCDRPDCVDRGAYHDPGDEDPRP